MSSNPAAIAAAQAAAVAAVSSQPRFVAVAATQFACVSDVEGNVRKAEHVVRDAARKGANIVLLQELFASPYFPIEQRDYFHYAISLDEDKGYLTRFQNLARELNVVIPISFYERANNAHFNSVLVIDADGSQLGVYRKSHIPDGPGYQEKYYFTPGNTGFRVFKTRFAVIGVGVCWDQWFPEAARCMALEGAEMLLYPTAIGSEPQDPANDTCTHWQRCMQGHAAANMVPIVASNRIGKEMAKDSDVAVTFYGSSFITDHTGLIMADAGRHQEMVLVHSFNMDELRYHRLNWGVFRDRRPELYTKLFTLDGNQNTDHRRASYPSQQNTMYAAARALPNSSVAAAAAASLPGLTAPAKKLEAEAMMGVPGMMPVDGDATVHQRMITQGNFDLHEASFIGDVKLSAQRRPRGRCWVCRNKTTYECKICVPGPVPLCNRTARDCWCKYHSGEVSRYVPNKRGRKRRKPENEPQQVEQHPVVQHAHQVQHPVQHAAVTHETEQHAADVNGDDEANKAAVAAAAAVAADPAGSAVDVLLQ